MSHILTQRAGCVTGRRRTVYVRYTARIYRSFATLRCAMYTNYQYNEPHNVYDRNASPNVDMNAIPARSCHLHPHTILCCALALLRARCPGWQLDARAGSYQVSCAVAHTGIMVDSCIVSHHHRVTARQQSAVAQNMARVRTAAFTASHRP